MTALAIRQLSFTFGGVHAVRHCSFEVESYTITALIGPNGAGKTTVFNLINGFLQPLSGAILFYGKDITYLPAWKRSRLGMSRTFQLSRLFYNLSIKENLLLASREDDDLFWHHLISREDKTPLEEQIMATLKLVGLKKNPNDPVTALSYGEQKLFDLARAFINPHTMMLLDEPVAGLNPVLRAKLKETIQEFKNRKETVLLIEHDMDFVHSVADRVIVLDQGSVLTSGSPDVVLRDPRVLEAYLGPNNKPIHTQQHHATRY